MNIPKVMTVVKELGLEPRSTLCAVKISGGALVGHAEAELKARLESYAADRNLSADIIYPKPERYYLKTGRTFLLAEPDPTSTTVSEALHGEALHVYDQHAGFSRVKTQRDGYLGWVVTDTLTKEIAAPTHRVSVPRAHIFKKPSVASFKKLELSLNVQVCVTGEQKEWLELELGDDTGYVGKNVVQALTDCEGGSHTIITLAQRFTETPYVWGGVSAWGLDCSGLVQSVFAAAGVQLPRDADQQEQCAEEATNKTQAADLLFFPGHVAIALNETQFIHANAHHMRVTIDSVKSEYGAALMKTLTSRRRIDFENR